MKRRCSCIMKDTWKLIIDNLNSILKKYPQFQTLTLEQLIHTTRQVPERDCIAIARNASGVYNHQFFFNGMCPDGKKAPSGALAVDINRRFGSLNAFREKFTEMALSVFGSVCLAVQWQARALSRDHRQSGNSGGCCNAASQFRCVGTRLLFKTL